MSEPSQNIVARWVQRSEATRIVEIIQEAAIKEQAVTVFVVDGQAGSGKTVLTRDIGKRFNSLSGYEPASSGNILWSGVLDMFDPETNSNQGIELRLISAFAAGSRFTDYKRERENYDLRYKSGFRGSALEKQRKLIEEMFARGLEEVGRKFYPVICLDTIERLESATDPAQMRVELQFDTSSVVGWLMSQLSKLRRGALLISGRHTVFFYKTLKSTIEAANADKDRTRKIQLVDIDLDSFEEEDLEKFFRLRLDQYPALGKMLNPEIAHHLEDKTEKNPLLLDMSLQILMASPSPRELLDKLQIEGGREALRGQLLDTYNHVCANPIRQMVLHYLAVARNGLFDDLLTALEPNDAHELITELHQMDGLPFIKVRDVYVGVPGQKERAPRRTYYLHDELYLIYDGYESAEAVAADSQRVANWYDSQIENATEQEKQRPKGMPQSPLLFDLLVESLIYRLRSQPRRGYYWFLMEEDRAIRGSISIGLDMRLRDVVSQYLNNALASERIPGQTHASPIDQDNVRINAPELESIYAMDSAMLWVKRISARGQHDQAITIAQACDGWMHGLYESDRKHNAMAYAEFMLWWGQALMYKGRTADCMEKYKQVLEILSEERDSEQKVRRSRQSSEEKFNSWRLCLVLGRTYNNMGYTCWMNLGQYRRAIRHFQSAVYWFRIASQAEITALNEELANTNDNLGRVYSLLGHHTRAIDLIQNGMEIRKNLGLAYREALSATSMALALNAYGQPEQALKFLDLAQMEFHNAEAQRGIGLSLITEGSILRNQADQWRVTGESLSTVQRYTTNAETQLLQAIDIFVGVEENIRLVQAYNELGCTLRARYQILENQENANPRYLSQVLQQGVTSFNRAIELAEEHHYPVEKLDSLQDLSVLYYRAGNLPQVNDCMAKIRAAIDEQYTIREKIGLKTVPQDQCVDAYYKILGQVEMLEGAITYDQGIKSGHNGDSQPGAISDQAYLDTVKHYVFAVVYFRRYSDETYTLHRTYGRMYKRFQNCSLDLIEHITQKYIPRLMRDYKLPKEALTGLFADVFGVVE